MFFQRKRRANPELPSPAAPDSHSSTAYPRSIFSLCKPLSRISTKPPEQLADSSKGPLGLNLLHDPADPKVDFIFVHGLGGGSRKTWSKTDLQSQYWPQEWLPADSAFENVRIHSYGHDSDYLHGKKGCFNVHHFGKSLLGAMSTSPSLASSDTRIVAIGHSMGGLVIKKAYLLARQDAAHKSLASRFTTIYFLATPHRGADSAKILKNILRVSYDRAYVGDLERNSSAIQTINDEFRHYSSGLELWSFYELQAMKPLNSMIVDPESAVLGYREEQQIPMNADHRSICKFETPVDDTYTTLRNALALTVRKLVVAVPEQNFKDQRDTIRALRAYLDVSDVLDDDFLRVRESRLQDTCRWISAKSEYINWRDGSSGNDRTIWIKGKPATGKSVLAGYVIDRLKDSGLDCVYFFFKHGDESKSSLSRCLRTIAFQMGCSNTTVAKVILELQADGIKLNHLDERSLWRLLFLSGIFKTPMARQYWVIDAADECSSALTVFNTIFSGIEKSVPLRILITCRDTPDLDQPSLQPPSQPSISLTISTLETLPDFKLLIEKGTQILTVVKPRDRPLLAEKILDKSQGSFLWTILVLKELFRCHSPKEINQVLEDIPEGMGSLYKRTLDSMSQLTRGKQLSKAILTWVACAIRPMTVGELSGALTLEFDDTFPRLEESIATLCGQLVIIDMFGKAQMVHETAREFLLNDTFDSEFAIEKAKAHTRMAQMCLTYLVGEEMKPPRTNRRRSSAHLSKNRQDFAGYACNAYSHHLSGADHLAPEPLQLIEKFFKANVLTWIEVIAGAQNLNQLVRASKHLATYANARRVGDTPVDSRTQGLQQWVTDLARISAMFASALVVAPSAVYSLIPPFCPTRSMIFGISGPARRITVLGALHEQWDDRLLRINYKQGRPNAVCYGDEFLAVGLTSGHLTLYSTTSFQENKCLDHGESVKFIAFRNKTNTLATCGMRTVKLWDTASGKLIQCFNAPPRPVDMAFDGQCLTIASDKNYLASWNLEHVEVQSEPTLVCWSDTPETSRRPPSQAPRALAFSTTHRLLAAAYSFQPITLWDVDEDSHAGHCGKTTSGGETSTDVVVALAFNANPDLVLLAVAYVDGELALLEPLANRQLKCLRADCQTLAASPDGRLLATGGAYGTIHVYEFDTFKVLYRVKSFNSYIKQISFARDGLQIAEIRGTQCTVWEPKAQLQDSASDDSSEATLTSPVETISLDDKIQINATVVHPSGEVVFGGKNDGSIVLYDRKTAASLRTLRTHKAPIRLMAWCHQKGALLCIDASNKISLQAWKKSSDGNWSEDEMSVFQSRLESDKAIIDVLVGEMVGKLLILTRESRHLLAIDSGIQESEQSCLQTSGVRKWLPHPQSTQHLICVEADNVCIYSWADLSHGGFCPVPLNIGPMQLRNVALCSFGKEQRVVLELSSHDNATSASSIAILGGDCFSSELNSTKNQDAPLSPQVLKLSSNITHFIGVYEPGKLVFLNSSSWVCSAEICEGKLEISQGQESRTIEVSRHFFVPYNWFAGRKEPVSALFQGNVMLAKGGDLAIIRGGFEHAQRVLEV